MLLLLDPYDALGERPKVVFLDSHCPLMLACTPQLQRIHLFAKVPHCFGLNLERRLHFGNPFHCSICLFPRLICCRLDRAQRADKVLPILLQLVLHLAAFPRNPRPALHLVRIIRAPEDVW
jgi:hypothetical protein